MKWEHVVQDKKIRNIGKIVVLLSACASLPLQAEDSMPELHSGLEKLNRKAFAFNDTVDRYTLKPLARAYQKVTPKVVDSSITHFFANLRDPWTGFNALLQGKPVQAGSDMARFLLNSTVGVAGFLEVAAHLGLPKHNEDLGQTLGVWGVPSGPYVVLPLMGPSTVRDTPTMIVDRLAEPSSWAVDKPTGWAMTLTDGIDRRADLLAMERAIEGDRYLFIRDAWMQQREFMVRDGVIEEHDDFLDDVPVDDVPVDEAASDAAATTDAAAEQGEGAVNAAGNETSDVDASSQSDVGEVQTGY